MTRRRRKVIRWLVSTAVLLVLVAGAALATGYHLLSKPYRGFETEKMLQIPRGLSTREMAKQLAEAGVIEHEWMFLAARAAQPKAVLQAGEYQFLDVASVWDVFDRIRRGDVYTFEFTVPEGSNIWDIARLLETQGIMYEKDFLAAASDPSPIRDLAPEAQSLEGYLFPATYRLSHKTTAQELCHMMVEQFRRQWRNVGGEMPPHEMVTLASLVEEETGVSSERGMVAGVFTNRLRIGMALACDPTVMYAARLQGRYRGVIYKADLLRDHPYNTYKNAGLPPGPISNPGKASLEAALHPAVTEALYFVAKPDASGHVFSKTSAAHSRAVQEYRDAAQIRKAARTAAQGQAN
ncbi:MAG: endolytic transglycosylase MltG [Acidobacteriota bacterium]